MQNFLQNFNHLFLLAILDTFFEPFRVILVHREQNNIWFVVDFQN